MLALQEYGSSDEEGQGKNTENVDKLHLKPLATDNELSVKNQLQVCAAPLVLPTVRCYTSYLNTHANNA